MKKIRHVMGVFTTLPKRTIKKVFAEIRRREHDMIMEVLKGPYKYNLKVPLIKGEIGKIKGIILVEPLKRRQKAPKRATMRQA